MILNIEVDSTERCHVVKVGGRVNGETSELLLERCSSLILQNPCAMVLDLTNVLYISSAGLSTVLTTGKKLDASGGKLLLCGLQGSVKDAFGFTGFNTIFAIFDNLDAALVHVDAGVA